MGFVKEELLIKLEAISRLHKKAIAIKEKMNNFEPEDNYERKVEVPEFPLDVNNKYDEGVLNILVYDVEHTADDAMEYISKYYDSAYHPKKPAEFKKPTYKGADTKTSLEKQRKLRLISNIGLGVSIFFLLGAIVGTSDTPEALPAILIIALLGAAAFVGGKFLGKKEKEAENRLEAEAKAEYDREIVKLEQQYNNTIKLYEDECNNYIPVREAFFKEYTDWREVYLESLKEEAEIEELLEKDRQAAVEKINDEEFMPVLNDLAELNDLVTEEYLPALDVIIDLLRSGRADDLKEAINLYEDIVYRERQLQLEREKEAQRRREEEFRRQDEERRYQEDKAFREQQERQRQYEEERRERESERRHQEEMKQREQQERNRQREEQRRLDDERRKRDRAELDRKREEDRATRHQCNTCALCGNCSMSFRRPNCASYRPR